MDDVIPELAWPSGRRPDWARLTVESQVVVGTAELWRAIADFGEAEGWICLPHEVVAWPGPAAEGPLLSAELARGDGTSLHIRREGRGWRCWRYREGEGDPVLVWRESYLGTVAGNPERRLRYAEYWSCAPAPAAPDGLEVFQPYAARFVGWEDQ